MSDGEPLAGRTVLVTGALGGLGAPIVTAVGAARARVAVHHLGQRAQADDAVDRLRAQGTDAVAVEADITDWDQVAHMVAAVADAVGPVDVLVNKAGYQRAGRFADL
jgi:3-oxoacyl-[acyl-carrier protein] reductase